MSLSNSVIDLNFKVHAFDESYFVMFRIIQGHKIYVQHRIKECSQLVWDVMEMQKGYFYIAGYGFLSIPLSVDIAMTGNLK